VPPAFIFKGGNKFGRGKIYFLLFIATKKNIKKLLRGKRPVAALPPPNHGCTTVMGILCIIAIFD